MRLSEPSEAGRPVHPAGRPDGSVHLKSVRPDGPVPIKLVRLPLKPVRSVAQTGLLIHSFSVPWVRGAVEIRESGIFVRPKARGRKAKPERLQVLYPKPVTATWYRTVDKRQFRVFDSPAVTLVGLANRIKSSLADLQFDRKSKFLLLVFTDGSEYLLVGNNILKRLE